MVLDCLDTLLPQAREVGAKVAVVDNLSQDDSVDRIDQWIGSNNASDCVNLIASDANGGFAAGNNIGVRSVQAEFYLLLNSDTLLRENALAEMLGAISSDTKVGALSPRLEWPDGQPQESCFRFHTPISQLISASNTGRILRMFSSFEVARRVSETAADYSWTSFACVLIRAEVFHEVGLLDEEFFMYFEDVEFCSRAGKKGWLVRNQPAAKVVHLRGGSSPVKSNKLAKKRQARYFYESRTRYFFLLYGRAGLLAANILWTMGWMVALLRSLVAKDFDVPACKLEWKDIWTNFFRPERPYIHPQDYK